MSYTAVRPDAPASLDAFAGSKRQAEPVPGWLPYHAVNDLEGLSSMLVETVRSKTNALDAFLFAAGMSQVVQDFLHRDVGELTRVAAYLHRLSHPLGTPILLGVRAGVTATQTLRWRFTEPSLVALGRELDRLSLALALQCLDGAGARATDWKDVLRAAARVHAAVTSSSSALRHSIAVPPRCFLSYDQSPDDCGALAMAYLERWPDRHTPTLVVGVRTSGSYLAPLVAAFLRDQGCLQVDVLSWRPDQPVEASERRTLQAIGDAAGRVLVVDDPPTSGGSLARVAANLEGLGVARDSIVLLVQAFAGMGLQRWPERLAGRPTVVMPFERWAIHDRLRDNAVLRTLRDLLEGRELTVAGGAVLGPRIRVKSVLSVERLPMPTVAASREVQWDRAHVRGVFRVCLVDTDCTAQTHHVLARGAGVGYFGTQTASIAERLRGLVPEGYGSRDGIFFRAWLPDAGQRTLDQTSLDLISRSAAAYAAARRSSLPVSLHVAALAAGHEALWERCAKWLGSSFGLLAPPLRLALQRASRRLLAAPTASVIDGGVKASDWFVVASGDRDAVALKTGFEDRVFRHQIPFSYDAAYDVATLFAGEPDPRRGQLARSEYESATGDRVDPERWFIHRLLHLREERDFQASAGLVAHAVTAGERALSREHEGYLGAVYLGDLPIPASGRLCAIDIDGVLETSWLSYPATTPAGAQALRALALHGYRPVLATGRALAEVRERCEAYRLAGGVAEYGTVIYDHLAHQHNVLLDARQGDDLERLRRTLAALPGVIVDPAYQFCVRAFVLHAGRRTSLEPEVVAGALQAADVHGRIRVIPGWSQVDFVPAGTDKAAGLRALAELMDQPADGKFLAMAMGDTISDLGMLECAELASAPANSDAALRSAGGVAVVKRSYQAGLLASVQQLVGHHGRFCSICSPTRLTGKTKLLMSLLAAQDCTTPQKLLLGARLALGVVV